MLAIGRFARLAQASLGKSLFGFAGLARWLLGWAGELAGRLAEASVSL